MTHTTDSGTLLHDFDRHRPALFGLAYRMLGSAMDAEDIVQETFLRWHQAQRDEVQSPRAYLMSIATRLCVDHLRSARLQRETYIGPWLPEPLVHDAVVDPMDRGDRADTLSFAFLLLLERLTPLERAVFILHDVFGYSFAEVAQMIGSNGPHCRQLGHRARERLTSDRARFRASPDQVEQAARAFGRASTEGDVQALLDLFATDISMWTDGGGKVRAARIVIRGADRVARFVAGVMRKEAEPPVFTVVQVNGRPGLAGWVAGAVNCICTFDVDEDGRIHAIYAVLNPEKLRFVSHAGG